MLTNLSSTKQTKVYKNRVINFETSRKSHDNFIFVASEDKQDMIDVLNSNLFKKQQLISVYMNRVIKPLGRKAEYIDLKDYYKDIKKDTKNRIKLGFLNPQMYQGRNIIYDGSILMTSTLARLEASRGGTRSNLRFARDFYPTLYSEKSDEIMYTNNILLFPLTKHIPAFRKKISMVNPSESNPLILFLKDLKEGKFQNYSNYDHAVIYSPSNKRMYVVDLSKKPDTSAIRRSFRLISFMNSLLGDGIDIDVEDIELDVELEFEDDGKDESEDNVKDQIKEIIINRFSDKLKAKLDDSDPISKEEENISVKLDQKIDSYLSKSENLAKPFNDLVSEIEADREIISNTLKYVESKKASMKKLNQLSQNLDKELESIISLQDIEEEINSTTIEGETLSLTDKYILPDPVKTPKVSNFDREYNRKQLKKDIALVLSGFSSAEFSPMSIQSIEVTDTSTDFNQVETYRVVYKTDDGARLTFSVDIPKIIDDRYFYLGGNKKSITKQMTKLPLIKSKADRVELTTNYSKITFERTSGKISRKNAYLLKVLERYKNNPNINIIYGDNSVVNDAYISDFEYEELATSLTSIKTRDFKVIFNRENMRDELSVYPVPIEFIEDERYTPFALTVEKDDENRKVIYINKDDGQVYQMELYSKNDKHKFETISADMFNFLTKDVLGMSDAELLKLPTIGKSFVFSQMKMFGAKYPIISVVGLTRGLEYVLKRHKVKYSLSDTRRKTAGDEVEVKFADKWLYYDGDIRNTMLLNALYLMETEKYKFTDFNTDEPYLNFFVNRMGQPMYIKDTMKINFDVIIDPITKEVLRDMKEPTDIVDVILKASDMLINNTYTRQNNMHNYRIRGNELVPAILYDVIAEAYVEYKRAKLNGQNINKLNIPKEKVIAKLIKLPNVNDHSTLNPILEIENVGLASPKGHIGVNMTRAYNLETRAYDASMMGVLSGNSTPVGANSGIARSLAYNNTITHVRGYIPATPDPNTLDGTEILGTAELLSPFTSTSADPTRQSMQVGQSKHLMPVVKSHKQLVGSGVNKTLAQMISDDFAFKAKDSGVISKVDFKNKVAILNYDSGKRDAIDLEETYVKNSNSGFYLQQKFLIKYKEGERFNKGDVIAYNPQFFSGKGNDIDYHPGTLAKIAIAAGDFSYEDSALITDKLAKKTASHVVMLKQVALGENTIIHDMVKVGDQVKVGDSLMEFTTSFDDPSAADFLANIASSMGSEMTDLITNDDVRSKYTGEIAEIKVYYNTPYADLHPTLQKLIKTNKGRYDKKINALEGIKSTNVRIQSFDKQESDKVGATKYEGVMIEFYIMTENQMAEGDKGTFTTALKFIASKRLTDEESPIGEYRDDEIIEGVLTPTGIISRMVSDIYLISFSNKVLIEVGKQIKEIMNNER